MSTVRTNRDIVSHSVQLCNLFSFILTDFVPSSDLKKKKLIIFLIQVYVVID